MRLNPRALVILIFFACCLVALPALAQDYAGRGRIQGKVTAVETGEPLEGVRITGSVSGAQEKPDAIMTDADGDWALVGIRGGTWEVIAEKDGYVPYRDVLNVPATGERVRSTIQMREIPKEEKEAKKQAQAASIAAEGNAMIESGDLAGARGKFEEALELAREEDRSSLLVGIAKTHSVEKNHDAAIETLEKGLEIAPGDPEILRLLIAELALIGRAEEAQRYTAMLPADQTVDPGTYFNMAVNAYNGGESEKALDLFNQALEADPELTLGYYYRGLTALNLGNNALALSDFQIFKQRAPTDPNVAEVNTFIEYLEGAVAGGEAQ
ncbi:MAG: tetratricopeptide repeat protein [Acidobacteriota bacterium]